MDALDAMEEEDMREAGMLPGHVRLLQKHLVECRRGQPPKAKAPPPLAAQLSGGRPPAMEPGAIARALGTLMPALAAEAKKDGRASLGSAMATLVPALAA